MPAHINNIHPTVAGDSLMHLTARAHSHQRRSRADRTRKRRRCRVLWRDGYLPVPASAATHQLTGVVAIAVLVEWSPSRRVSAAGSAKPGGAEHVIAEPLRRPDHAGIGDSNRE